MAKSKGLGMGMDALFYENDTDKKAAQTLKLTEIEPNKSQPRTDFDEESIVALADSIKQHGVLQPLLVRPLPSGRFQIVAGERRWRASRMAGLSEVPVLIKELDDRQTMQLALIENLQRENLNPIEEAQGYKDLMETYDMTQEQVARVIGKSRSAVANSLRLLSLDPTTMKMVRNGEVSVGHAKVLAGVEDSALRTELASRVKRDMLTVRALEEAVKNAAKAEKHEEHAKDEAPKTFFREVEISLREAMNRRVKVSAKGEKGKLEIEFYSEDDLKDLAELLTRQ